jgi:hypothetical protein
MLATTDRRKEMVTGMDIMNKAAAFIGQPDSNGIDGNGLHPWSLWCEAFVEMVHEQCGLTRVRYPSALSHARSMNLSPGRAPVGAMVFFGTDFYFPDGHISIATGDGRCLGTVTDGTGVGFRNWNETTTGYLGWAYHAGIVTSVQVQTTFFADGNPFGNIPLKPPFWGRWHQLDQQGLALPIFGWPKATERVVGGRRMQEFERGWLATGEGQNPWDVVTLLKSEWPAAS